VLARNAMHIRCWNRCAWGDGARAIVVVLTEERGAFMGPPFQLHTPVDGQNGAPLSHCMNVERQAHADLS
jgi:hypothetical protein